MIDIVTDRDLILDTEKYDVILLGTSVYCMLTAGIQSKMRFKYPFIEEENNKTAYGDMRKLGKRLTLTTATKPIISLMYICGYPRSNRITIDYDSLEKCLLSANSEFSGMNVASTIIGTSKFDGNGSKEKCLDIIEKTTPNINLTLYDYKQKSRREEINEYKKYIYSFKKQDKEKYKYLLGTEESELKKLYLK